MFTKKTVMKKIYLFALLNLFFGNAWSQTFGWAKNEGLWAYDYGMGIANDNAGNVYVAGKYEMNAAFSGTSVTCAGNHDMFLAKYSSTGSLTWIRTGGDTLGDYSHAIACDGSNYVYTAGEIEGYGDLVTFPGSTITVNTKGDNDIVLTKYDLSGNLIWAKSEGGNYSEKALGVTYDNSGNVYICGYYIDTLKFSGTTTLYGSGVKDAFIAKYDINGNFQWVKKAGGPGRDEATSIKCDAAGNVYVCGFYSNNVMFGTQTYSVSGGGPYYDAFIAKYASDGSLQWVKTAGGSYDEVAWSLTMDNAGLIYICGEFNASAEFATAQLITTGNADVFVACYNSSGTEQWVRSAGGPLIDRARGIGCDGTNLYITGQFGGTANFGGSSITAADSSDVFFVSLNSVGVFTSATSVGGVVDTFEPLGYESGTAICAEPSGNVYATGGLLNGGTFGSITVSNYDRTDAFVTKLGLSVGVNNLASSSQKAMHVYPNPGNGVFTVDLTQYANQKFDVTIYNCLGQSIEAKMNRTPTKLYIDLSAMEDGIYFIELKDEGRIITTKKVVVQK